MEIIELFFGEGVRVRLCSAEGGFRICGVELKYTGMNVVDS